MCSDRARDSILHRKMAPGRGKGDWKSKGEGGGGRRGGGGGSKDSRYQRQQGKGSKGKGGRRSYADASQAGRLSGGGRKETTAKAALREQGDNLDKRFGCVCVAPAMYGGGS